MYAAWLCGMVFLDKISPQSRADSVEKMVRVLKGGSSVILYPEGAWNNTENLLVQPLFAGPWLLARRTGCKVVPIAMYHTYKAKDIYFRAGPAADIIDTVRPVLMGHGEFAEKDMSLKYANYLGKPLENTPWSRMLAV